MPVIDGLELLRRLRAAGHAAPVIMMTAHGDVPLAVEAMKLEPAISSRSIRRRDAPPRTPLRPEARRPRRHGRSNDSGVHPPRRDPERTRTPGAGPSGRGGTSKEIGRTLDISPRTVEIYRAKLMRRRPKRPAYRNWCGGPCWRALLERRPRTSALRHLNALPCLAPMMPYATPFEMRSTSQAPCPRIDPLLSSSSSTTIRRRCTRRASSSRAGPPGRGLHGWRGGSAGVVPGPKPCCVLLDQVMPASTALMSPAGCAPSTRSFP